MFNKNKPASDASCNAQEVLHRYLEADGSEAQTQMEFLIGMIQTAISTALKNSLLIPEERESVEGDVLIAMLEKIDKIRASNGTVLPPRNFLGYVYKSTKNKIQSCDREQKSLSNRLKRCLKTSPRFAVWTDRYRHEVCGLSEWGTSSWLPAQYEITSLTLNSPSMLMHELEFDSNPQTGLSDALTRLFEKESHPIRFNTIMDIFRRMLPVFRPISFSETLDVPSELPDAPLRNMIHTEDILLFWDVVQTLSSRDRCIFLLTGIKSAEVVFIELLINVGVSRSHIAEKMRVSPEVLEMWIDQIPLDDETAIDLLELWGHGKPSEEVVRKVRSNTLQKLRDKYILSTLLPDEFSQQSLSPSKSIKLSTRNIKALFLL